MNLLNNHDVMVLCNILLLVSTCGQRSDYLSAGETFQSKEQKLPQFKLAQNTKWRSLIEVLDVSDLADWKLNIQYDQLKFVQGSPISLKNHQTSQW